MAASIKASGSQTATISTTHTVLDTADLGVYVFVVDTNNMVSGDVLELTIVGRAASGVNRTAFRQVYLGAPAWPLTQSFHIAAPYGAAFTLRQTAGTGRAFPWVVMQLDG